MKTFKIQFCHPIKGTMHLLGKNTKASKLVREVDSLGKNELEIPLDDIENGDWKLLLNWEHDGREFIYKKDIHVS